MAIHPSQPATCSERCSTANPRIKASTTTEPSWLNALCPCQFVQDYRPPKGRSSSVLIRFPPSPFDIQCRKDFRLETVDLGMFMSTDHSVAAPNQIA